MGDYAGQRGLRQLFQVVVWDKPGGVRRGLVETLKRTNYLDPKEQAKREEKLNRIRQIRVNIIAIQFGIYFCRPASGNARTARTCFSNEFEIQRGERFFVELLLDYTRKPFRIEVRVVSSRLKTSGVKTSLSVHVDGGLPQPGRGRAHRHRPPEHHKEHLRL